MEKIVCETCKSEYDRHEVDTPGGDREPTDELCEVCGAVLERFDPNRQPVLVLTKRGNSPEAA